MDKLSKLAIKYGTDRYGKHHYTQVYHDLFKDKRREVKAVLELGVGEGAGLFMWRDYFPLAMIYGADNDPKRLFDSQRIKVYRCDQSNKQDLIDLIDQVSSSIDLFIDDGSHIPKDQLNTCLTVMPLLKKDTIYIIEDVSDPTIMGGLAEYDCKLVKVGRRYDDRLIICQKYQ